MNRMLLLFPVAILLYSAAAFSQSPCTAGAEVDVATGRAWLDSSDFADQIRKEDDVMGKVVRANQRYVKKFPRSCVPIEIKVATPFGDATGSFDPVKEKATMRIPTGKTTFKMMTLSTDGDFWTLRKDGVTEATGTFSVQ